jgi:hypothetical protein
MKTMKRKMFSTPVTMGIVALAVYGLLFFAACGTTLNDHDYFDSGLRGTWVNINPYDYDEVEITMDTIEITPDSIFDVPGLNGFTSAYPLKGYSKELSENSSYGHKGNLFINDKGDWQTPVPYSLWGNYSDPRLTIGNSGNQTTFKKQ